MWIALRIRFSPKLRRSGLRWAAGRAAEAALMTNLNLTDALSGYTDLFSQLLTIGLAGGAVLLVLSPVLKRMMHGVR